jgi:DNA-binding MarR family transcriptional regulator
MAWCPNGSQLDQEIFDAMAEFLGRLFQQGDALSKEFGIPVFCLKALHRLGSPITMKELGEQLHVDRSFVTMIADTLEERGLARREPHPGDRRIKNLVLSEQGLALKQRLEAALLGQMPWSQTLGLTERASLLELIRKMNAGAAETASPSGGGQAEGVSGSNIAASLATALSAKQD